MSTVDEELIVKSPAEPGPYGYRPHERPLPFYIDHGVINLDKPRGPTSHTVTRLVKRILEYPGKIGHCGTLDPKVSGVLPIVLGNATKLSRLIAGSDKEYIGVLYIHGEIEEEELLHALEKFTGPIFQRPPVKSAVKRSLRVRRVYSIDLLESEGRFHLLKVHVESGTYIRKLFYDIGEFLGVGGSMRELRRIRSGGFNERDSITLEELFDAYRKWKKDGDEQPLRRAILPLETVIVGMPKVIVKDSAVASITHGASLKVRGISSLSRGIKKGSLVAIMSLKGELIAIGRSVLSADDIVELDSGIAVEIERVVMPRDLYPPMWRRRST
ncbi:MAG: RNA-guided pseudouridylation complex pseudouridine synthase subunit Cbf5 [Candidatus Korarchaeota archaeon]|nr:RNA-guided pseudouridylation complex pseudouridine synthase subunit Cbf5 [Candidatus Korarchaeota archaeon]